MSKPMKRELVNGKLFINGEEILLTEMERMEYDRDPEGTTETLKETMSASIELSFSDEEAAKLQQILDDAQTDAVAAYIDSAVRVLYNSSKELFKEIWGDDGAYLWDKFTTTYNGDQEGAFICYLDQMNQRKLARYVQAYALKHDRRLS